MNTIRLTPMSQNLVSLLHLLKQTDFASHQSYAAVGSSRYQFRSRSDSRTGWLLHASDGLPFTDDWDCGSRMGDQSDHICCGRRTDGHELYSRSVRPTNNQRTQLYHSDARDGDAGNGRYTNHAISRMCVVRARQWQSDFPPWSPCSAGVSQASLRPDCEPRSSHQPVQLRIWSDRAWPTRGRTRQLPIGTAYLPFNRSGGSHHCRRARGTRRQGTEACAGQI